MTRDVRLTDQQIERMLERRSLDPYAGLTRDILAATAGLEQDRHWHVERPSSRVTLLAAAALLAALLIGGTLAAGAIRDLWDPVPPPLRSGWTGPLRPGTASMPKIVVPGSGATSWEWTGDPSDVVSAGIDITGLRYDRFSGRHWVFELGADAPYPTTHIVEYGVVLDDGADGVADCMVGINNDAPQPVGFRVWVTNPLSGETREQVGPPYGMPADFGMDHAGPSLSLDLLTLATGEPCSLKPRQQPAFYAWASESVDGEVVAWDYAPDAAWLVPGLHVQP